jgi:hypothetical protein
MSSILVSVVTNESAKKVSLLLDVLIVIFNTMVGIILFTAPWFQMSNTVDYNFVDHNDVDYVCTLSKGTVIVPFKSTFCGVELVDMKEGGKWSTLKIVTGLYLAISSLMMLISVAALVMRKNDKLKDHYDFVSDNAFTVSAIFNLGLLVVLSILIGTSDDAPKPDEHIEDTYARTLLIVSLVASVFRELQLFIFMAVTKKHNPHGVFGTGARADYGI